MTPFPGPAVSKLVLHLSVRSSRLSACSSLAFTVHSALSNIHHSPAATSHHPPTPSLDPPWTVPSSTSSFLQTQNLDSPFLVNSTSMFLIVSLSPPILLSPLPRDATPTRLLNFPSCTLLVRKFASSVTHPSNPVTCHWSGLCQTCVFLEHTLQPPRHGLEQSVTVCS